MALVSPKLSSRLQQFTSFQVVLLLQANLAPFVKILFAISIKCLLNQGLSIADAESAQEKCAKCSLASRSNTVLVRYSVCTKGFHQKWSTGLKASTRDNQWECEKCTNFQQNCIIESTNCQLPGLSNLLLSQALPAHFRNKPVER